MFSNNHLWFSILGGTARVSDVIMEGDWRRPTARSEDLVGNFSQLYRVALQPDTSSSGSMIQTMCKFAKKV